MAFPRQVIMGLRPRYILLGLKKKVRVLKREKYSVLVYYLLDLVCGIVIFFLGFYSFFLGHLLDFILDLD